jgi:hypothetical protein
MIAHGLRLSAAAIAVGQTAALILTRAMKTMLVGIKPTDPLTFVAMVALFLDRDCGYSNAGSTRGSAGPVDRAARRVGLSLYEKAEM